MVRGSRWDCLGAVYPRKIPRGRAVRERGRVVSGSGFIIRRSILIAGNLAYTCSKSGRHERALQIERDVHAGWLRLYGEEDEHTLIAAGNYANSLLDLARFEEAKALLRRTIPVARRVLGDSHRSTLVNRCSYAKSLFNDDDATLDDLREAVTTHGTRDDARRVLGDVHPDTAGTSAPRRDRAAPATRLRRRRRRLRHPRPFTTRTSSTKADANYF